MVWLIGRRRVERRGRSGRPQPDRVRRPGSVEGAMTSKQHGATQGWTGTVARPMSRSARIGEGRKDARRVLMHHTSRQFVQATWRASLVNNEGRLEHSTGRIATNKIYETLKTIEDTLGSSVHHLTGSKVMRLLKLQIQIIPHIANNPMPISTRIIHVYGYCPAEITRKKIQNTTAGLNK